MPRAAGSQPAPGQRGQSLCCRPGGGGVPRAGPLMLLAAGPGVAPLKRKRGHHARWQNAAIDTCHHGDCWLPPRLPEDGDMGTGFPSPLGSCGIQENWVLWCCFSRGKRETALPPSRQTPGTVPPRGPLSGLRWFHLSFLSCLPLHKYTTLGSGLKSQVSVGTDINTSRPGSTGSAWAELLQLGILLCLKLL